VAHETIKTRGLDVELARLLASGIISTSCLLLPPRLWHCTPIRRLCIARCCMAATALPDLYQLRIRLCGVSPLIWCRLLVRSDTSIAELHNLHRTFER
jgi:hypothetical protein